MTTNLLDLQQASFDEGFTPSGSSSAAGAAAGFPVSLGGRGFVIDPRQYRRRTLPILRSAADQNTETGEGSLSTESPWRRFCRDWSLGAGQDAFDDTDSSRRRFFSSKGVDPWTRHQLSLLPATESKLVSANSNLRLLVAGGYLYVADGAALKYTTDPSIASPTWTTVTTAGLSTITSLATNGSSIFVCDGTKIMSGAVGSAALADLGTYAADVVGYANGHLLAANDEELVEVAAAGTTTAVKDHDNTGFDWNIVCAAPNGIYAAGNAGNINEVYFVGIDTSTGGLAKPTFAGALPEGETLHALVFYGGAFLMATSKGVRLAVVTSDNGIAYGPVIDEPGECRCVEPEGNFVWFGWTNYDASSTGLGRANLAAATDAAGLVPAFASDLMAGGQGTVTSVVTFDGRRYFTVSGTGVFGEQAGGVLVASGTVDSGWISYGLVENKVSVSFVLRHMALPSGAIVTPELLLNEDDTTAVGLPSSDVDGSYGPVAPDETGNDRFEKVKVNLTLTRATDATAGPTLRHWLLKAYPVPGRIDEIIVPLRVSDTVSDDDNEAMVDVLETWQFLKAIEAAQIPVTYVEGASTYLVYVSQLEVQPNKWNGDRAFFDGLIFARLVTVEG